MVVGSTVLGLVGLLLVSGETQSQTQSHAGRRIALFGSSVPNGTGDEFRQGGYTGHLRQLLEPRGWEVLNQSRGGDSTLRLSARFEPDGVPDPDTRYLTTVDPDYVVIAFSLDNAGIKRCNGHVGRTCAETRAAADLIFQQFSDRLGALVRRSRDAGIVPIVTLPYTHADFWGAENEYTRRMSLLLNTWDVPTVNLLGALDDGQGRWTQGFFLDNSHPNAAGHLELYHAFVPSLFEALEVGKPLPTKATSGGFVRARGDERSPLSFEPGDTMRSFAVSFMVRSSADGAVASVGGQTVNAESEWKHDERRSGTIEFESTSLTPSGHRFQATVSRQDGRWLYASAHGNTVASSAVADDDRWHHVVLSHSVTQGRTRLYLDGELIGAIDERLQPDRFVLGGPGPERSNETPAQADCKAWRVYRAALNVDEVVALRDGVLLQASMEVYAPLVDPVIVSGELAENRAQSMSVVRVNSRSVVSTQE